ncbi:hypothetical protein [Nocardia sp. NPDC019255]|uniref:hypothetical protein n=1 Tax=Nocardia sp. NPDC019255 TaxID=3154591 RepID=UPI0033FBFCCA
MQFRSYDQGGPLIPHPVTLDMEWNAECGHHLSAWCLGCSTCTDCTQTCYCGAAEDEDPPVYLLDLAS